MKDLTIIIPAKDEKESLPTVIKRLESFNCEIIITMKNDDIKTIESINGKNIKIFYQSGKGYGNSLKEAIENCRSKYFCIFNADGSFEQNDLPKMYTEIQNYDFVYTTRYEKPGGSDDDTILTLFGNKFFSLIGNLFFSLKISDILYTFLMGNTNSFKKLNIKSNDFRFCVELPLKMELAKMKYKTIPSYEKKRIGGKKKVNEFKDGFLILIEMIKLFFEYKIFKKKII
tara:strand:- start:181 stop:867 length:687 start_codon:yes stop_codon:yes gene_type:complete